jgi:hypothetical protein
MRSNRVIQRALEELLRQPEGDGTFVIFEHSPSGKFVQFCGSVAELLQLDLPAQALSELEFYKAVAYFKRRGIAGEEYDLLDAPGGMPVAEQFSFQMSFRSVDAATEVVLGVFKEVYQVPGDCCLEITRGWQV